MENNKHDAIMRNESIALMKRPEWIDMIFVPVADVFETADTFVVKLDIPGATKEFIILSIEPDRLTVKAAIDIYHKGDVQVLYSEIGQKSYMREFNLGNGINRDGITAQFENGVLIIALPKTDAVKAREITIQ